VKRGPRALCFRGRRLRGGQREVQIRWFHSVGRWVLLQRHYGVGSYMAVACSVQGCLFSWFSLSALDCTLAVTSSAGEGGLPHRLGFVRPTLSCGVALTVLMPQSNRSGLLEVVSSSPCVNVPI